MLFHDKQTFKTKNWKPESETASTKKGKLSP
jgi:hypothetical protein